MFILTISRPSLNLGWITSLPSHVYDNLCTLISEVSSLIVWLPLVIFWTLKILILNCIVFWKLNRAKLRSHILCTAIRKNDSYIPNVSCSCIQIKIHVFYLQKALIKPMLFSFTVPDILCQGTIARILSHLHHARPICIMEDLYTTCYVSGKVESAEMDMDCKIEYPIGGTIRISWSEWRIQTLNFLLWFLFLHAHIAGW